MKLEITLSIIVGILIFGNFMLVNILIQILNIKDKIK